MIYLQGERYGLGLPSPYLLPRPQPDFHIRPHSHRRLFFLPHSHIRCTRLFFFYYYFKTVPYQSLVTNLLDFYLKMALKLQLSIQRSKSHLFFLDQALVENMLSMQADGRKITSKFHFQSCTYITTKSNVLVLISCHKTKNLSLYLNLIQDR